MNPGQSYERTVAEFAEMGSEIIRLDPVSHYKRLRPASRPLEPGFIPLDRPPILTTISYYPNETQLPSEEYMHGHESFKMWGSQGDVDSYSSAYRAWLSYRDQIPFFRKWEAPLYEALGIRPDETAWLPLIKCPLPAGTNVEKIDIDGVDTGRDLELLWKQLNLIKPGIVLVQGAITYDMVGRRLDNLKFIRLHPMQKIPQYPKAEMMSEQLARLKRELEPHIASIRS